MEQNHKKSRDKHSEDIKIFFLAQTAVAFLCDYWTSFLVKKLLHDSFCKSKCDFLCGRWDKLVLRAR